MTTYKAAIINSAGIDIVLIMVDDTIISQQFICEKTRESARIFFSTQYVYLVGKDVFGKISYWGTDDNILKFLSDIDLNSLEWQIFYDRC